MGKLEPPTGHVYRRDGARRSTWYAKYRLPDGRQVQRKLGPAWTDRGRPPAGYLTKRTAEAWLRDTLDEARRGTLPGLVKTGATFADAAAATSGSRISDTAQPRRIDRSLPSLSRTTPRTRSSSP